MARKRKSRLITGELEKAKSDVRKYVILTGAMVVFGFFFGLPIVTRFAAFVHDVTSGDTPIEITDKTPPAPPQLRDIPEFTNKENLEINGTAEPGSTVKVYINSKSTEVVANNEGAFSTNVGIRKGENKLWAIAVDESGNESQETNRYTITYDNEPPEVQINKPQDGDSFYGDKNRTVSIEGQSDGASQITVNGRVAIIETNGKFSQTVRLDPGTNEVKIKASDVAGNETEFSISLTYSE